MKNCIMAATFTLICVGMGIIGVSSIMFFIPASLVATSLFALVTTLFPDKLSQLCSRAIICVFYVFTLIFSENPLEGLVVLFVFLPVGLSVGLSNISKKNFNSTGVWIIIAGIIFSLIMLASYTLYVTYPDFSASDAMSELRGGIREGIRAILVNPDPESLEGLAELVFLYIPTIFAVWFLATGTIAFWLLKSSLKKYDKDYRFMGEFSDFHLNRTGAVAYFISTIILLFVKESALHYALSNFFAIMTVVFVYAGISFVSFMLDFKNIKKSLKIGICILCFLLPLINTLFLTAVSLLGVLDSYLDMRNRLLNSGH